jgi:hypothetical protein
MIVVDEIGAARYDGGSMLLINLLAADAPERKMAKQRESWRRYAASPKGKVREAASKQRRKENGALAETYKRYHERNAEERREASRTAKREERKRDPQKLNARNRRWREANPENRDIAAATAKQWRADNGDRVKQNRRRWLEGNPAFPRINQLRGQFGLSVVGLAAIVEQQGGRCAICRCALQGGRRQHVDHDHVTGMVRGVLCSRCNTAIGQLCDDPVVIARAAEYVRRGGMP